MTVKRTNSSDQPNVCKDRLCKTRLQEDAFDLSTTDEAIPVCVGFLKHLIIAYLVSISNDPLPHCSRYGSGRRLSITSPINTDIQQS